MNLSWINLHFVCLLLIIANRFASGGLINFLLRRCPADSRADWSYSGRTGPKYWGDRYPSCNGQEQSPITISRHNVIYDRELLELEMINYDVPVSKGTIENDGHSVKISPMDNVERAIQVKGEFYQLQGFHFHWGDAYYKGSEHIIDGTQYAMELHFVHKNQYNELAVVGVLFQEQSGGSPEFQSITSLFPEVLYKGMKTQLETNLNLNYFLPGNPASFYRYEGSLTTPGCDEGVIWSVLTKPVAVSSDQMAEFRKLYSVKKWEASSRCKLSNNYRPVQKLNQRTIFASQ